jgi:hypothetical protein
MLFRVPIKSFLPPTYLQFLNQPCLREYFQITIHRCQAYPWQFFLDAAVQLIRSRMSLASVQFVQNNLALMSHA